MVTPNPTYMYLPTGIYSRMKATIRQERHKGKEINLPTKKTQRQKKMHKTLLLLAVGLCLLVGTQAAAEDKTSTGNTYVQGVVHAPFSVKAHMSNVISDNPGTGSPRPGVSETDSEPGSPDSNQTSTPPLEEKEDEGASYSASQTETRPEPKKRPAMSPTERVRASASLNYFASAFTKPSDKSGQASGLMSYAERERNIKTMEKRIDELRNDNAGTLEQGHLERQLARLGHVAPDDPGYESEDLVNSDSDSNANKHKSDPKNGKEEKAGDRRLACATPTYSRSSHSTLILMSAVFLAFMAYVQRWAAKEFRQD